MNRSFDNIEYTKFPGHDYRVGYAPLSGVWHIHNSGRNQYYAVCMTGRDPLGAFYSTSLQEVSDILRSC